uniref:Uncharacterized protein n=1 Tax=Anguilla anguilla TaxID=7936 RepID=A0A0E9WH15_ANGAN
MLTGGEALFLFRKDILLMAVGTKIQSLCCFHTDHYKKDLSVHTADM